MNCANHPEVPVAAYCQNCGKPLCAQCVRSVAGVVYCEPCLAARLHGPSAAAYAGAAATAVPGATAPGWNAVQDPGRRAPQFRAGVSPVLAGLLGIIPGVGAMYNGQFIKALVHVVVFIILIGVTNHFDYAGFLIAAWVFYQIFDAIQTAIARRDGLPLPDPFGLNDLGQRLGVPGSASYTAVPAAGAEGYASSIPGQAPFPAAADPGNPSAQPGNAAAGASSPDWNAWANQVAATHAAQATGVPVSGYSTVVPPPAALPSAYLGRPEPVGAIVLIAVGMLFLLSTLGVFHLYWVGHGWPILIIALGVWLLVRRARSIPPAGGTL